MSMYKIDILKAGHGEFWTNVYYVDTADITVAVNRGLLIAAAERGILLTSVVQERMRVSTMTPGDDIYTIVPIEGAGSVGDSAPLPLFNVVRVDLSASTGRPGRKYLRGCLGEMEVAGDILTTSFRAQVQANYVDEILSIDELRHVDGQTYQSGVVFNAIGMRQLRRGSKRKAGEIIPPA